MEVGTNQVLLDAAAAAAAGINFHGLWNPHASVAEIGESI
jgi:hypothetical protein